MLRRPLALVLALLPAAAACSSPRKPSANAIDLTIERGNAPSGVDHLDIEVAGLGMTISKTDRKDAGASELPLPDILQIAIPAGAKGTAIVTVVARNASNGEIARGTAQAAFAAPQVLNVTVTLQRAAGSPDAGTASPPDAGATTPEDSGPTAANLTADMPSIDFGDVVVGRSSPTAVLTVKNTGGSDSGPLMVTLGGDSSNAFVLGSDGNCSGVKLYSGQSCKVSISFMPDRAGALRAMVAIAGTPGGDITVVLTGSGLGLGRLSLLPSMNNFGSVVVGAAPASANFTLTNSGESATGTITVVLDQSGRDYAIASDACSRQSLAAGGSCVISVHFQPVSAHVATATLAVSARPGGAQASTLFGRGLAPAALSALPATVDFGNVVTGQSVSAAITITNTGQVATTALVSMLGGQDAGEFSILQDMCSGMMLMPGASCMLTVQSHPSTTGAKQAALTVSAGSSVSVPLSANALAPGALSMTPATDTYPAVLLGTDGETHTITVRNSGGGSTGPLAVSLSGSGASQFVIVTDGCTNNALTGGGMCTVTVRFHPTARGGQTASLLASAAPGGAVTASLNGNGLAPAQLSGDASSTTFGTVDVTRSSPPFTWTITNSGDVASGPLQTSISGSTGDFATMNNCTDGQALNPGASCTIVLTFAPASGGSKSLTVTVSGTPGGSAVLTATGTGRGPVPLTVSLAGSGAGSVASDVGGISCGTSCSTSYVYGTMVTLTATPHLGSTFSGWTGGRSGTGACVLSMTQMQSVSAGFTLNTYPLTVNGVPAGASFTSAPQLSCANQSCTGTFTYGTSVNLSGASTAQYAFGGFSGGGCNGASCAVSVTGDTVVNASYSLNSYTLTVTGVPAGASLTSNPTLTCANGSCSGTFVYGTGVSLSGASNAQYAFSGLSGGGCNGASCNVTLTGDTTVNAGYSLNSYQVTVNYPTGAILSASSNPALTCGNVAGAPLSSCTGSLPYGTMVTLTAANDPQYSFSSYTGDACGASSSCSFSVQGTTTITANFGVNSYTLTVTAASGGQSGVNSLAGACAAGCSYAWGTSVNVFAIPAQNWSFSAWSDDPQQPSSRNVVITGNLSLQASFTANQISLFDGTVSTGGTVQLSGFASSNSANPSSAVTYSCDGNANNCPGAWTFDQGTEVVFTATPNAGGWFINPWQGNIGANVPSTANVVHISNVGTDAQGLNWIVPYRRCFNGVNLLITNWALLSNCARADMSIPVSSGFNSIGVNFQPPIQ